MYLEKLKRLTICNGGSIAEGGKNAELLKVVLTHIKWMDQNVVVLLLGVVLVRIFVTRYLAGSECCMPALILNCHSVLCLQIRGHIDPQLNC